MEKNSSVFESSFCGFLAFKNILIFAIVVDDEAHTAKRRFLIQKVLFPFSKRRRKKARRSITNCLLVLPLLAAPKIKSPFEKQILFLHLPIFNLESCSARERERERERREGNETRDRSYKDFTVSILCCANFSSILIGC